MGSIEGYEKIKREYKGLVSEKNKVDFRFLGTEFSFPDSPFINSLFENYCNFINQLSFIYELKNQPNLTEENENLLNHEIHKIKYICQC